MSIAASCVHGARLCFVPHPSNDHHPLALRHGVLAFTSALLITIKVLTVGVLALTPETAELSTITTARIVQLTNNERKKKGLVELTVSDKLARAAQDKGEDMLKNQYFAHISPTGVTPWFWMAKYDYIYQVAGENLAIDFNQAEDVVSAWLASPTHRDNMLFPEYTETGIAVVTGPFQGGTSTIVVHEFGRPQSAPAAIAAPAPAVAASSTPRSSLAPSPKAPGPSIEPSPTASMLPVPRIALVDSNVNVSDAVSLMLTSEPNSTVNIVANYHKIAATQISASGSAEITLDLSGLPDGAITIRAFAVDSSRRQSILSDSLTLTKASAGPPIAAADITGLIGPDTDNPTLWLDSANQKIASFEVMADGKRSELKQPRGLISLTAASIAIAAKDSAGHAGAPQKLAWQPSFHKTDLAAAASSSLIPAQFSKNARQIMAAVAAVIAILLTIAILVRVRVQRPLMIAHSSLVILLALAFLFW